MRFSVWLLGFSIVAAVLASILQVAIYDDLKESNRELTISLQKSSSGTTDFIFKSVSLISLPLFLCYPILDFLLFKRDRGFYGTLGSFGSMALYGILKNTYAQARPFWIYSDIEAISCSDSWGAPSGHMLGVSTVGFYYIFLSKKGYMVAIISALIALTAYDRVYLGVHSYFQVILGCSYGLLYACLLHFSSIKKIGFKKPYFWLLTVGASLLFLVNLLLYMYREPHWDSVWEINYEDQCDKSLDKDDIIKKDFLSGLSILLFYGFFFGFSILRQKNIYDFNWKFVAAGIALLILGGGLLLGAEYLVKEQLEGWGEVLLIMCIRLILGFFLGYCTPFALDKIASSCFQK